MLSTIGALRKNLIHGLTFVKNEGKNLNNLLSPKSSDLNNSSDAIQQFYIMTPDIPIRTVKLTKSKNKSGMNNER